MTLHIGMTMPSRELEKSSIDLAITQLAEQVAIERMKQRLPVGPTLDITFLLSSGDDKPPFTGMMMGGYTAENKTLFFKTAVPEHITQSSEASRYVSLVLQDAIENADDYFQGLGKAFDKKHWMQAVESFSACKVIF